MYFSASIVNNSIHLTVARSKEEKEKSYSAKIRRCESLKHRFGGEGLAQMVNAAQRMRSHCHCDALEKQRFAFFEKLAHSVYK